MFNPKEEKDKIVKFIKAYYDRYDLGGVVIGICSELNIPVKFIGVGEKISDLQKFNANDFAKALLED